MKHLTRKCAHANIYIQSIEQNESSLHSDEDIMDQVRQLDTMEKKVRNKMDKTDQVLYY